MGVAPLLAQTVALVFGSNLPPVVDGHTANHVPGISLAEVRLSVAPFAAQCPALVVVLQAEGVAVLAVLHTIVDVVAVPAEEADEEVLDGLNLNGTDDVLLAGHACR